MADRDKYGNYVNDEGVTIKITTDKRGNDHVSFYGGEVDKPHDAAHVNVNYDKAYSRYKNSVLALEEQFARPVLEQRLVKTLKLVR